MNGATSVVGGVPVAYRANRKHRGYGVKSSLGDHNADHHRQLVGELPWGNSSVRHGLHSPSDLNSTRSSKCQD